jgi:putative selenium metabolism hydrolase
MSLEERARQLAEEYLPAAIETLQEAIRIPADRVDRPLPGGGDPLCGTSNHEASRLEYLKSRILELKAVERPEDVGFDAYGNLRWTVEDREDEVAQGEKKVIFLDGHVDTVAAMRSSWLEILGGGLDAYEGMIDPTKVDEKALKEQLGSPPPRADWSHMVWGRGAADQLAGVVCQIFATRMLLELREEGALRGVRVCCFGTVAEEDNDGGGTMHYMAAALASGAADNIPDVLILSEPTGSAELGPLGIYRGQRGRMQIEVEVTGKSAHGSMPWEGLNPLEHGAAIIAEATRAHVEGEGFSTDEFLGPGSRTASMSTTQTPSDCAVPDSFTVRFDRRLTVGEDPQRALDDMERLQPVAEARDSGLRVEVRAPQYEQRTWRGHTPSNPQIYPGWQTPEGHPAIAAAAATYRDTVAPMVEEGSVGAAVPLQPRIGRWVFSTDGVGASVPAREQSDAVRDKNWVESGEFTHPAMFGIGPGVEENTHKIGECVDSREMMAVMAFYACFPVRFRQMVAGE